MLTPRSELTPPKMSDKLGRRWGGGGHKRRINATVRELTKNGVSWREYTVLRQKGQSHQRALRTTTQGFSEKPKKRNKARKAWYTTKATKNEGLL